jgi:hypothetical protein
MKHKVKYHSGDMVKFAGKLYKITDYKKAGFTGAEYNLEALKPTKNGFFERCFGIPEGFINKV